MNSNGLDPGGLRNEPNRGPGVSPDGTRERIESLPREVGVLLMSVGALGFVMPGMVGVPALLAGGMVLWPGAFGRVDTWLGRRWPDLHRGSMRQIGRFLDDLEKRYPPDGDSPGGGPTP